MSSLCVALAATSEAMLLKNYLVEPAANEGLASVYGVIVSGVESKNTLLSRTAQHELNNLNSVLLALRDYARAKRNDDGGFVAVALGKRLDQGLPEATVATPFGLNSDAVRKGISEARAMRFIVPPTESLINADRVR